MYPTNIHLDGKIIELRFKHLRLENEKDKNK